MPRIRSILLAALLGGFLPGGICLAAGAPFTKLFSLSGEYSLGARVNRTDYESIDAAARRLYISKMGGGQLLVFDLERNRLVAQLDGFPKVTGVLAVPEIHRVYASVPGGGVVSSLFVGLGMAGLSKGRGTIAVLDSQSLKEVARLPGGVFPDGIAYDAKDHRVFVSDELGSALIVIDAVTNAPQERIATGGEVGNVRYDPLTGRIYVPVQSNNELAVIDPERRRVVTRYNLPGCDHPHGFIVAPNAAVGFAACDGNDRLAAIDLATGRTLHVQAVAHDPDVLAIDPHAHLLYVAGESGNLSSFDIAHPDAPHSLGDVFIADGAHAVAVDPVSHRLYFALADMNGRAVLRVFAPKS
jgi:DNA-binding beta-propeller fold protein YncE